MIAPFTFKGRLRQAPYARWSIGIFFLQHAVAVLVFEFHGRTPALDWMFFVAPLRQLVQLGNLASASDIG